MFGGKDLPSRCHFIERMGLTIIVHPRPNGLGIQPVQGVLTGQMDPTNTGKESEDPLPILLPQRPVPVDGPGTARLNARADYEYGSWYGSALAEPAIRAVAKAAGKRNRIM